MKKSFVLIAAILAVVGLGAAVAVAKETIKVGTSVSIDRAAEGGSGSAPPVVIGATGRVNAKKGCEKHRRVGLHSGHGEIKRSDTSDKRGYYFIRMDRISRRGYWVVVDREIIKKDGDRIVCKRARSRTRHFRAFARLAHA
jgi:hypothetical protein